MSVLEVDNFVFAEIGAPSWQIGGRKGETLRKAGGERGRTRLAEEKGLSRLLTFSERRKAPLFSARLLWRWTYVSFHSGLAMLWPSPSVLSSLLSLNKARLLVLQEATKGDSFSWQPSCPQGGSISLREGALFPSKAWAACWPQPRLRGWGSGCVGPKGEPGWLNTVSTTVYTAAVLRRGVRRALNKGRKQKSRKRIFQAENWTAVKGLTEESCLHRGLHRRACEWRTVSSWGGVAGLV